MPQAAETGDSLPRAEPDPERPALVLGYGNLADSAAAAAISALAESL